jgi:hypothetical protein
VVAGGGVFEAAVRALPSRRPVLPVSGQFSEVPRSDFRLVSILLALAYLFLAPPSPGETSAADVVYAFSLPALGPRYLRIDSPLSSMG